MNGERFYVLFLLLAFLRTGAVAQGPSITPPLVPSSGPINTSVTINGTNFGSSPGVVSFTGLNNTTVRGVPTAWTTSQITVPVPNGAATGNVVVTANNISSAGVVFTVTPQISSLSPASERLNHIITISGSGFGSAQGTVRFNSTNASISSWSDTTIGVVVPAGLPAGPSPVVVSTAALLNSPPATFTIAPTTSLLQGPALVGVALTGMNFGSTQGSVKIGSTAMTITSWSSTAVNVQVPTGALSGGIVVTTSAGTSGGTSFTVTGTFGCP